MDSEGQGQIARSDQGLHCTLYELLDTTKERYGEQMPEYYFEHAHNDLNLRILFMSESSLRLKQPTLII